MPKEPPPITAGADWRRRNQGSGGTTMPTVIKISREDTSKRFWVIAVKDGNYDHLRSFRFDEDEDNEDEAYALAEVFAEGIVRGFGLAPDLLPKNIECPNR